MSLCTADVRDAERQIAKLVALEGRQLARLRRVLASIERTRAKIARARRDHAKAVDAVAKAEVDR